MHIIAKRIRILCETENLFENVVSVWLYNLCLIGFWGSLRFMNSLPLMSSSYKSRYVIVFIGPACVSLNLTKCHKNLKFKCNSFFLHHLL